MANVRISSVAWLPSVSVPPTTDSNPTNSSSSDTGLSMARLGAPAAGAIHDVNMISSNAVNLALGNVGLSSAPMGAATGMSGMGSIVGVSPMVPPATSGYGFGGGLSYMPGAYGAYGGMTPMAPYGMAGSPAYAGAGYMNGPLGFSSPTYGTGGYYNGMALTHPGGLGAPTPSAAAGMMGMQGPSIGTIFQGVMSQLGHIVETSFITSALMAVVTDGYQLVRGRVSGDQAMADIAVDTVAYTGIGTASTVAGSTIGGYLGTLIPVPIVGTLIGMGVGALVGLGLGWAYEAWLRPSLTTSADSMIAPKPEATPIVWPDPQSGNVFGTPARTPTTQPATPTLGGILGL